MRGIDSLYWGIRRGTIPSPAVCLRKLGEFRADDLRTDEIRSAEIPERDTVEVAGFLEECETAFESPGADDGRESVGVVGDGDGSLEVVERPGGASSRRGEPACDPDHGGEDHNEGIEAGGERPAVERFAAEVERLDFDAEVTGEKFFGFPGERLIPIFDEVERDGFQIGLESGGQAGAACEGECGGEEFPAGGESLIEFDGGVAAGVLRDELAEGCAADR